MMQISLLWQKLMEEISTDYTLFFNLLESLEEGSHIIEHFKKSFYQNLNKEQETFGDRICRKLQTKTIL